MRYNLNFMDNKILKFVFNRFVNFFKRNMVSTRHRECPRFQEPMLSSTYH